MEKSEYIDGIYIGMAIEDFCRTLDILESGEDHLSYYFNVGLEIYFENQVLSKLVWRGFEDDVFFVNPWQVEYEVHNYYGIINTGDALLRAESNGDSEVLIRGLEKDRKVEVLARNGIKVTMGTTDFYWFKVKYQDHIGWVHGERLDFFNTNEDGILEKNKESLSGGPWNGGVEDSGDNKFIGFVNYRTLNKGAPIGDVFVYQKHILLEELVFINGNWHGNGFTVYEYDENLDYCDYGIFGKELLKTGEAGFFAGMRDGFLFVDSGTGYGLRGFDVWDVAEGEKVFSGIHYDGISYHNGVTEIVYPLRHDHDLDDEIKAYAEEFIKNNAPPLNEDGLDTELLVICDYNLRTGERKITGGKYVFGQ
jgi:hypothetical protein